MHTYETLFITSPNLTEEEEQATVEALAVLIPDGGGEMITNDRMGRRRLAYPIRKFEDGVYTRFLYDSTSEVPKELERRIRLSDKVLRSLTVRLEEDWAVAAKEEAVREAERRVRVEAERAAEAAAAEAAAEVAAEAEAEAAAAAAAAPDEPEVAEETEAPEKKAEAVETAPADAPAEAEAKNAEEPSVEETATEDEPKIDS